MITSHFWWLKKGKLWNSQTAGKYKPWVNLLFMQWIFLLLVLRTWLEEGNIQFFKNLSVQMNMTLVFQTRLNSVCAWHWNLLLIVELHSQHTENFECGLSRKCLCSLGLHFWSEVWQGMETQHKKAAKCRGIDIWMVRVTEYALWQGTSGNWKNSWRSWRDAVFLLDKPFKT